MINTKRSVFQNNPGNTPEFIASALRNAILQGRYKANQPLRRDHLAEELVQLKAEGLVTFMPKRGAVVSQLSAAEVEEIYTMRIALESLAIEKAISRLRASDMIRAQSVLEIIDTENDKTQWGDLNWEFHATLYQAAQMPISNGSSMIRNNPKAHLEQLPRGYWKYLPEKSR